MSIGTGKFYTQLNEMADLLKGLGILEEYNQYPEFISLSLGELRRLNYEELWKTYFRNNNYHFQLKDSSLILFCPATSSFTYIANPRESVGFSDFIVDLGFEHESNKHSLYPDYEQYLSECGLIEFPVYIRYDFDENSYNSGLHPVSHLHIGYGNTTRFGLRIHLNIESFVHFILRQLYSPYWEQFIKDSTNCDRTISNIAKLNQVDGKYYNELDQLELYLSY